MRTMRELFRTLSLLVLISCPLHLVWESVHVRLYTGYEHLSPVLPIYVWATIADVLYTLGAFALVSAFKGDTRWLQHATLRDYLALAAVGFFLALFVEYKALALNRWAYLPEMPIIPYFHVGLSPIVQMTLLFPFSLLLVSLL